MALELEILRHFAENWEFSTKHTLHIMLKYNIIYLIMTYCIQNLSLGCFTSNSISVFIYIAICLASILLKTLDLTTHFDEFFSSS